MSVNIGDKALAERLQRYLAKAQGEQSHALARLASGSVFIPEDPMPAARALAEKMEFRLRSLSASKRNINDAMSLLQTADSSMAEINNLITRMKEINISAANTTVSDQDRRYLFIEYEALHDEINRITLTTEFNGIPLLHGASELAPEALVFRVGDPVKDQSEYSDSSDDDINTIRFPNFRLVNTTTDALGLKSAKDLIEEASDSEGINLENVEAMLLTEDSDDHSYPTIYDQAIANLSNQRALFGGLQARLNRSLDFIDVYEENISAAKSRISDTDYAEETTKMLQSKIQAQASSALLAQSQVQGQLTMQLLNGIF